MSAIDPNGVASGRIQPSLIPSLVQGLDLSRTLPGKVLGTHVAAPAATFEAGNFVTRDVNGQIVLCTGSGVIGMAKWNKATSLTGLVVGEQLVLPDFVTAVPLAHPLVAGVVVMDPTGTVIPASGNYTLNATNGTITATSAGLITAGETVTVNYQFTAQTSDLAFAGRNFFNFIDDTATQQGRIAVIQGFSTIFTGNYDTSVVYAINQVLYCSSTGKPTTTSGGDVVGKVSQLPTSDDPYLGFEMNIVNA